MADTSLDEMDDAEGGLSGDRAIHDRDVRLLGEADCVVAEVTIPSHGVGYEIGRAVSMSKKILCLYRPQDGKSNILQRVCAVPVMTTTYLFQNCRPCSLGCQRMWRV